MPVLSTMQTFALTAAMLGQPQDVLAMQNTVHRSVARSTAATNLEASPTQVEQLQAPKWTRESPIFGHPSWECGHVFLDTHLPKCDPSVVTKFHNSTRLLQQNVGNLSEITGRVFMLVDRKTEDLSTCIQSSSAFITAEESVHNPLRVIVDAQYINRPRCCHGEEIDFLVLNETGGNFPWTDDAVNELENVTEDGLSFFRARPKKFPCTQADKCPLVVQIAGAAGNPWFLVQNHCTTCQHELGAVIISPFLEKDMLSPDGGPVGTSGPILRQTIIPFLEKHPPKHPEIDADRIYLVAQSLGDDTALRLALMRPDLISLVSLSGKNLMSPDTLNLLKSPSQIMRVQSSRLRYIQWNIGDADTTFADDEYFLAFAKQVASFTPGFPRLDLRIYPESFHSVWWAAWNSLHEVIWTGQRSPEEAALGISTTCRGAESDIQIMG